MEEVIILSQGV